MKKDLRLKIDMMRGKTPKVVWVYRSSNQDGMNYLQALKARIKIAGGDGHLKNNIK